MPDQNSRLSKSAMPMKFAIGGAVDTALLDGSVVVTCAEDLISAPADGNGVATGAWTARAGGTAFTTPTTSLTLVRRASPGVSWLNLA